jgi:hypothetical protein
VLMRNDESDLEGKADLATFAQHRRAGSTAVMCGSTFAGPLATWSACARLRKNWSVFSPT